MWCLAISISPVYKIEVTDGKVYFNVRHDHFHRLHLLRSVERIFIKIFQIETKAIYKGSWFDVQFLNRYLKEKDLWMQCAFRYDSFKRDQNDCGMSPPKKSRYDTDKSLRRLKTFRVSCKCAGGVSRHCKAEWLSRYIGRRLSKLLSWKVELRHPDVEISVHVNDKHVVAGIPLLSEPLSKRNYILHHGLRSTVAWIMCNLAKIQPGNLVLDPLCGKATILLEGARHWPGAFFLGVDCSGDQLEHGVENIIHARTTNVSVVKADVNYLPLNANTVDAVVCDLPFGKKHVCQGELAKFYSVTLKQIDRVLKPGGHVVLLTSCELEKVILQSINITKDLSLQGDSYVEEFNLTNGLNCSRSASHCARSPDRAMRQVQSMTELKETEIIVQLDKAEVDIKSSEHFEKAPCLSHGKSTAGSQCTKDSDGSYKCPELSGSQPVDINPDNGEQDSACLCWTCNDSVYIKLGETHARLCTFQKK